MIETSDKLIETIQASGFKACIVVTGGGSGAVHALLSHPGASRFVLEAQVPYNPRAMFDYLGEKLEQHSSKEAAEIMVLRAYERALMLTLPDGFDVPILGIACTAALQTNRERKGEDRAYICIKSRRREIVRKIDLEPGSRIQQESVLSEALLNLIAEFVGDQNP